MSGFNLFWGDIVGGGFKTNIMMKVMSISLKDKEVPDEAALQRFAGEGSPIRKSVNHQSAFDEQTRIIIVGTLIPPDLEYFFLNQPRMYRRIDASRGTDLEHLQQNPKNIAIIKDILKEQGIAFCDLCEMAVIPKKSTKDKDIKKFVFYEPLAQFVSAHPKVLVVAISRFAEKVLKKKLPKEAHIEYCHFFRGGKGHGIENDDHQWIGLFNSCR